mmetsp:Transcript_4681/g.7806  ORF Transcript_4681/g.7806 Transcript_4681/m.7806 type:complete len:106 (+) Transcript_4681:104-421(+)|eukprot:CAMPEP_0196133188 /NCGR_PEP_ID=MMETSP0910-20130528/2516_1 /TAXON_ID=49265 /ORGANISM="Thalassiosira rotula, Strain GSO102" /LENGTH=105 /DNA_ID=CAMNT_0041392883 /DNA_START=63 /DNA_END=380 /DNA_ORIENTATION=+
MPPPRWTIIDPNQRTSTSRYHADDGAGVYQQREPDNYDSNPTQKETQILTLLRLRFNKYYTIKEQVSDEFSSNFFVIEVPIVKHNRLYREGSEDMWRKGFGSPFF